MTDRLYFRDSYQTDFEADVVRRAEIDGKQVLVLNKTCFYPTAGGQQCDHGVLNDIPVIDVREENDDIVHVLEEEITADHVRGVIEWKRRFDFMQQHSGQHILSQSFFRVLNANTVSSHLGEEFSTLEIDRETLTREEADRVEDVANEAIYANRPIKTYSVPEEEVGSIPLRRPPKKEGPLRIVEIEHFDFMGCGGTHCRRSGEIGLIKAGRWEKIRGHIRIQFLCGYRALKEYRWKHDALENLSDLYSAKASDVYDLVTKQVEESKILQRDAQDLLKRILDYEARDLLVGAERAGDLRIIKRVFMDRPADELKTLALQITGVEKSVVLFGTRGEKNQLVFCCSDDCLHKMNELVQIASATIGGKGGGSPQLAFGGGPAGEKIEEAVEGAVHSVVESDTTNK